MARVKAADVILLVGGRLGEMASQAYTLIEIPGPRHADGAAHGSGCTHSSTLAAHLARGASPLEAARAAKKVASEAVANGLRDLGQGPGPVDVLGLRSRLS